MPYLEVRGLQKAYVARGRTTHVLGGVDLSVDEGEFVAIVGYSGSGKTTLVSLIAGLHTPDAGRIVLDGTPVREPGPERGIVFQQYSLLPSMTGFDNVALAVDAVNAGTSAEPVEPPDAAYPLILTTGRVRDHWHTLTRTTSRG